MNDNIVMTLAIFTLGAGVLFALWSFTRAKKAQYHHEGAAAEGRNPMQSDEPVPPEKGKDPPTPMPPPD
jgi:hypothetical protein